MREFVRTILLRITEKCQSFSTELIDRVDESSNQRQNGRTQSTPGNRIDDFSQKISPRLAGSPTPHRSYKEPLVIVTQIFKTLYIGECFRQNSEK